MKTKLDLSSAKNTHYNQLFSFPGLDESNRLKIIDIEEPIWAGYSNLIENSDFKLGFFDYFRIWSRIKILIEFYIVIFVYDISSKLLNSTTLSLKISYEDLKKINFSNELIERIASFYICRYSHNVKGVNGRTKLLSDLLRSSSLGEFVFSSIGLETVVIQDTKIIDLVRKIIEAGVTSYENRFYSLVSADQQTKTKLDKLIADYGTNFKEEYEDTVWQWAIVGRELEDSSIHCICCFLSYLFDGTLSLSSFTRSETLSEWKNFSREILTSDSNPSENEIHTIILRFLYSNLAGYHGLEREESCLKFYVDSIFKELRKFLKEIKKNSPEDLEYESLKLIYRSYKERKTMITEKFIVGMI